MRSWGGLGRPSVSGWAIGVEEAQLNAEYVMRIGVLRPPW
jgi:hypothetical protein